MSLDNYKYVVVNSFDSFGTSDSDFYVPLNGTFREEFSQMALVNCVMTATYYNVDSSNNTFNFQEDSGSAVSATLTAGNYTITDMLSSLKTAMEAVSPNTRTYTLTVSGITNLLTITGSAGTFSVLTTGGLNLMLGFSRSTASGQHLANTGTRIYNLCRYGFLNLTCSVTKGDTFNTIVGNRQDILSYIPVSEASFGDVWSFRPQSLNWIDVKAPSVDRLEIKLVDDSNNVVDLNGGYISLYIALK